jgi:hypothetical protein
MVMVSDVEFGEVDVMILLKISTLTPNHHHQIKYNSTSPQTSFATLTFTSPTNS